MPTAYVAMEDVLLVVSGVPDDPTVAETLSDRDIECVAAHPETPDRVFCGTFGSGLHRSADGGRSWERVGADVLASDAITAVAVAPRDSDVIWAGTEPSAVACSTDGGSTWTETTDVTTLQSADRWSFPPRPHTHHVRWIEPDPTEASRLYVGIEAGALLLTEDEGETWRERPPGSRYDNHSMATHPDASGRVYAAAGDGYAESTDGGETWAHPQSGLDRRYCWSVAPDPADPDTVILSAATGPRTAHSPPGESAVYRRVGTHDWTLAMDGLPGPDGLLRPVLDPGESPGTIYVASNRGLFRTRDAAESWERLDAPWAERFASQAPAGLAVVS